MNISTRYEIIYLFEKCKTLKIIGFYVLLVPPAWIQKPPEEKDVIAGASLELPCSAKGSPKPSILWKREMG